jgi:hypothetical protein
MFCGKYLERDLAMALNAEVDVIALDVRTIPALTAHLQP